MPSRQSEIRAATLVPRFLLSEVHEAQSFFECGGLTPLLRFMSLRQFEIRAAALVLLSVLLFFSFLQPLASAQSPREAPPPTTSYDQVHRLTEQGKFDEALSALN